jgi:hypothetical protein
MTDQMELFARMAVAEGRLAAFAENPPPGLTDADPATGEQWDAGQPWAHIAAFVPYWQGAVERGVTAAQRGVGGPIPFGRTSADPVRVEAIESGRNEPPMAQMARLGESLTALRTSLVGLSPAAWSARGVHSRLGEMTVAQIVERFVVGHLEEHADQLAKLAAEPG